MFATSEDDTNSLRPTSFDVARIDSLSIGESVDGELGNWTVLRYKDSYVLMTQNSPKIINKEFKTQKELIRFLENH